MSDTGSTLTSKQHASQEVMSLSARKAREGAAVMQRYYELAHQLVTDNEEIENAARIADAEFAQLGLAACMRNAKDIWRALDTGTLDFVDMLAIWTAFIKEVAQRGGKSADWTEHLAGVPRLMAPAPQGSMKGKVGGAAGSSQEDGDLRRYGIAPGNMASYDGKRGVAAIWGVGALRFLQKRGVPERSQDLVVEAALTGIALEEWRRIEAKGGSVGGRLKALVKTFDAGTEHQLLWDLDTCIQGEDESVMAFRARYSMLQERMAIWGMADEKLKGIRLTNRLKSRDQLRLCITATTEDEVLQTALVLEDAALTADKSASRDGPLVIGGGDANAATTGDNHCWKWKKKGVCDFGSKCKFQHDPKLKGNCKEGGERKEEGGEQQAEANAAFSRSDRGGPLIEYDFSVFDA